ncbi:MAG: biotin/lipoyl-binding protein [Thermoplasmata archaeon]|nr:biotin/lipoyl-binding protein [Thermoplasmata archaeon]
MRIALVVDGTPEEVLVDLARSTVTVRGAVHPLRVVRSEGKVELEVDGETLTVEGWPAGLSRPPGAVSVNGEVVGLEVRSVSEADAGRPAPSTPVAASASTIATPTAPDGPGTPVMPPMPGKVIEVRVTQGQKVDRGQVLLVLEAMKMRNEVVSPLAGRVEDLRVAPGTNVRSREPMLRVVPE